MIAQVTVCSSQTFQKAIDVSQKPVSLFMLPKNAPDFSSKNKRLFSEVRSYKHDKSFGTVVFLFMYCSVRDIWETLGTFVVAGGNRMRIYD